MYQLQVSDSMFVSSWFCLSKNRSRSGEAIFPWLSSIAFRTALIRPNRRESSWEIGSIRVMRISTKLSTRLWIVLIMVLIRCCDAIRLWICFLVEIMILVFIECCIVSEVFLS